MSERHTTLPIIKHNQQLNNGEILNNEPAKKNYCYFSRIENRVPTKTTDNERYINDDDKETSTHLSVKQNEIETNKVNKNKLLNNNKKGHTRLKKTININNEMHIN